MIFYLCAEAAWTASSSRANHSQNGKNKNSVQRKQKKIHSCTKVEEKMELTELLKALFCLWIFFFCLLLLNIKELNILKIMNIKYWVEICVCFCSAPQIHSWKKIKVFFIYTTNDINHIHISYTRYVWVFSIHNVESYRLGRFWFFCCAC